ncbi:FAD-binding protein [Gluconacetobacter sp. 1b LMG 1731]|uniref:D-lactate dehydrogenase (cytochrome) n=1 Tax=Gluconacetobacter dulcium TaxID=2729096 RepID=A0A7W4NWL3_9PROT|nr:FAD-linked oxidase C-terminal domain-containing protein [Gluconacetobacter dulcium]MBB2165615.1 FAD-binding protein [Gluconacetobacter dulcium]MBB2194801.1 FAD-binding protein [Gluconacetobacter dulcium]MBB2195929.1 FAD-binding protein [Gluconacetobacter dulcium]
MNTDLIAALRARLGEDRVSTAEAVREQHSHGEGHHAPSLPGAVVFAQSTDDVAQTLALCSAHGVPLTAFGAGTSLEGHVNPPEGGISLDLSRMTDLLSVHPQDMDCRVQAGITRQALNQILRDTGLFFPVDPGGEATIGGMCATRASGTAAVRYGTIRENVLGLTVVLADGRVMRTGGRVRKSSTGYDLTHLLIGSEGTLGVITEIQLRLHPIPETIAAAVVQFETLADAVATAIDILQFGVPIGRVELLDDVQMDASIRYSSLAGLRALPTLFLEFVGGPDSVREQIAAVEAIVADRGGLGFDWHTDPDQRAALWRARHHAYWACLAYRPGYRAMTTDAIVPISALTELVTGVKADIAESGLTAPIVGHVGDGNFHTIILAPPTPEGLEQAWALDRKIVRRALALGGSCSGEHGVGLGKRAFMADEHDPVALDVMRALKRTLDPNDILNPGKMLPGNVRSDR